MAIIKPENFAKPLVLDIVKVASKAKNQYDLPFYFMGQVLETNFDYEAPFSLLPMGDSDGYQHLYLEGKGKPSSDSTQFNWLVKGKFYTLTAATKATDELLFARLGAQDPEFNLRRDAALMFRRKDMGDTLFVSVIEPHGLYSPVSELSVNPNSNISSVKVVQDSDAYTAVVIENLENQSSIFIVANADASVSQRHRLTIGGKQYSWQGPYYLGEESMGGLR
jgi:hypothetical protein